MKRITRAHIISEMSSTGRPQSSPKFADVCLAGMKAGLDYAQGFDLACIAYDAQAGNVEGLTRSCTWLRKVTLRRLANETPLSLWGYMRAKLGSHFPWITDEEIRDTSVNDFDGWSAWAREQRATSVRS